MCLLTCDPARCPRLRLLFCGRAAAPCSAPSLSAQLDTHKIQGSCKFTATCPGNCLVLPRWCSPGAFPGRCQGLQALSAAPRVSGPVRLPVPQPAGVPVDTRGCPRSPSFSSGQSEQEARAGGRAARQQDGRWEWAARPRSPAAAARNEVTF